MPGSTHPARRLIVTATLAAAAVALPRSGAAQATPHHARAHAEEHAQQARIDIPESMRIEHQEIHAALERATRAPGQVGAAARDLAALLHPHFVREEQIALPPLGLLAALARGEATPEMRAVLPLTDSLRAELPRMLEEHRAVRAATARLGEVARAEGDTAVARLAETLALHARTEEEVFYPAAVLVGELVRARTAAPGAP